MKMMMMERIPDCGQVSRPSRMAASAKIRVPSHSPTCTRTRVRVQSRINAGKRPSDGDALDNLVHPLAAQLELIRDLSQ